jgi:hypothetical protein
MERGSIPTLLSLHPMVPPPSERSSHVAHKARCVTCNDCFFRKTSLCALDLAEPCPTFRPALKGQMVAPPQARLVDPTPQFAPADWLSAGRVAAVVA